MTSIDITPVIGPNVWQEAFDRNGILGITVDDAGEFTVTDHAAVVRTLAQALLLHHVRETLVSPSHAQALRGRVTGAVEQIASTSSHIQRHALALDLVPGSARDDMARFEAYLTKEDA